MRLVYINSSFDIRRSRWTLARYVSYLQPNLIHDIAFPQASLLTVKNEVIPGSPDAGQVTVILV